MSLTETKIKSAKSKEKVYRLTDGQGLTLAIFPNGSKSWQLRYRFNNKENTYSIGLYPLVIPPFLMEVCSRIFLLY